MRSGDTYVSAAPADLLDYAYRHQLRLTIEVEEAVKFLENIQDPFQGEAEKDLHLYLPEKGKDWMVGKCQNVGYKTGFGTVEQEIDFLERVCAVEEYFHVKLAVQGTITEEEYQKLQYLSDLVREEKVQLTWQQETLRAALDPCVKAFVLGAADELRMVTYVGKGKLEVFRTPIEFRLARTFQSVVI